MKYALYLGCTTPAKVLQYELSTRSVCKKLGIELIDLEDFSCCGSNMLNIDTDGGWALACMNLAVAERDGLNIMTLCAACTGVLAEAAQMVRNDPHFKERMNGHLQPLGLECKGEIEVKHVSKVLYEDVGIDKLKNAVSRDLSPLRIAPHYGCHYLKPSFAYPDGDGPGDPHTLHELLSLTGAEPVDYERLLFCCGGKTFPNSQGHTFNLVDRKLLDIATHDVDCITLQCQTCGLMYGAQQKAVREKFGRDYSIPVFLYPQILGLALGLDPYKELGFQMSWIDPKPMLEKI